MMPLMLMQKNYCPERKDDVLLSECVACQSHLGIDHQRHEIACVWPDPRCDKGEKVGDTIRCKSAEECLHQEQSEIFPSVRYCRQDRAITQAGYPAVAKGSGPV